jgi:hypothetical protein
VIDDLVATAIEAAGRQKLWNTLRGLTVDLYVVGPIWAMKGWLAGTTFDQTITLNTVDHRPLQRSLPMLRRTRRCHPPKDLSAQPRQHREPQPAVHHPRHRHRQRRARLRRRRGPDMTIVSTAVETVGRRLDDLLAPLIINMGGDLPAELRNTAS